MATWYVWSGATGAGDGSSWTDAYTTITGLFSTETIAGGDVVLVHTGTTSHHYETSAVAINLGTEPSGGAPAYIIGVDKDNSNAYTPEAVSVNLETTGSTADISISGSLVVMGLWLESGDNITLGGQQDGFGAWVDCTARILGGNTNDYIRLSGQEYKNCTFYMANGVLDGGPATIIGGSVSKPASSGWALTLQSCRFIGVDFTGCNCDLLYNTPPPPVFIGCRFNASYDVQYGVIQRSLPDQPTVQGSDTDAGNNQFRFEWTAYGCAGYVTDSVYRSSGATYDGTNEYSIVLDNDSAVGAREGSFVSPWQFAFVSAGTKTFTVYITHDSNDKSGNLQDDEVWLDLMYYESASHTGMAFATTLCDISDDPIFGGTPSDITADATSSWTESFTGSAVNQKLVLSNLSVAKSGFIMWRVRNAIPSVPVYMCPKIEIS